MKEKFKINENAVCGSAIRRRVNSLVAYQILTEIDSDAMYRIRLEDFSWVINDENSDEQMLFLESLFVADELPSNIIETTVSDIMYFSPPGSDSDEAADKLRSGLYATLEKIEQLGIQLSGIIVGWVRDIAIIADKIED
jgi:hypothetical protein